MNVEQLGEARRFDYRSDAACLSTIEAISTARSTGALTLSSSPCCSRCRVVLKGRDNVVGTVRYTFAYTPDQGGADMLAL